MTTVPDLVRRIEIMHRGQATLAFLLVPIASALLGAEGFDGDKLRVSLRPADDAVAFPLDGGSGTAQNGASCAGLWLPIDPATPAGHLLLAQERVLAVVAAGLVLALFVTVWNAYRQQWVVQRWSATLAAVLALAVLLLHMVELHFWVPAVLSGMKVAGTVSNFGTGVQLDSDIRDELSLLLLLIGLLSLDNALYARSRWQQSQVPAVEQA